MPNYSIDGVSITDMEPWFSQGKPPSISAIVTLTIIIDGDRARVLYVNARAVVTQKPATEDVLSDLVAQASELFGLAASLPPADLMQLLRHPG